MRALLASMVLLLAGCGFQPLYAPPGGGAAIGPVQVTMIEGKAGHVLKTELDRILAVENSGGTPALLDITLLEYVSYLGIRIDESASRAEMRLVANYVLTPAEGGDALRGSVNSVVNFDIDESAFASAAAQDDARERAAETMAQRFRAELAIRLAQRRNARAP